MKEIIIELNNLKILQKSIEFTEDLPQYIYELYFKHELANSIDVEKHRWYETSITVFTVPEGILGVRSVTDICGETNEVIDILHILKFLEMDSTIKIAYKIKK